LVFKEKYALITILYKGFVADNEGLPYLTSKEVDAIAAFCAYVDDFKKARMTRDASTFQMAQVMELK
jgi:hypothetical protein